MKTPGAADQAQVSRFLDGQLSGAELAEFERRLLSDRALRDSVEEQRQVQDWFGRVRAGDTAAAVATPGFVDEVLREARRLPSREALESEPAVPGETQLREKSALRTGRVLVAAAALIMGFALVTASGLLQPSDSGRLDAQQQRLDEIDRAIAEEARRQEEQQPR